MLVRYNGIGTLSQSIVPRSLNMVHNGRNFRRVIFHGAKNDIVWVKRAEGAIQNILHSGQ
jgi:hypothetical protein